MLTQSLIIPVALLWILSNLSVSFLEGGVANRIKQSSWYLTTSEQECNSYLLCLLCNTAINLSQNCICFIFLKTDCYYWLTFSCRLTAIPTSSPAVLLPLAFLLLHFSISFLKPKGIAMYLHYFVPLYQWYTECHFSNLLRLFCFLNASTEVWRAQNPAN